MLLLKVNRILKNQKSGGLMLGLVIDTNIKCIKVKYNTRVKGEMR